MYNLTDRFIKYAKIDTRSMENQGQSPSTPGQLTLALMLLEELKELNLENVVLDCNGFVYATLPSNTSKDVPVIGLMAHMDTCPNHYSENVNPKIHKNYQGETIVLNEELGIQLIPDEFPELYEYIGQDIITTDGTTLLGADDKAGIAEIMTVIEYLTKHPQYPHGTIKIAFTPDEELDFSGISLIDLNEFDVDIIYTVDGEGIGLINSENFNGAITEIKVNGNMMHSGIAKNKMINALIVANEFINLLPPAERPEHTSGYDGFYHLTDMSGDVESVEMLINIRDFKKEHFENKKTYIHSIADFINKKYKKEIVTVNIKDIYYNMSEINQVNEEYLKIPKKAMKEVGIISKVEPIRGGTDGSIISSKGSYSINIFTGVHNPHSKYEFIPVQSMEKAVEVLIKIIELHTL